MADDTSRSNRRQGTKKIAGMKAKQVAYYKKFRGGKNRRNAANKR